MKNGKLILLFIIGIVAWLLFRKKVNAPETVDNLQSAVVIDNNGNAQFVGEPVQLSGPGASDQAAAALQQGTVSEYEYTSGTVFETPGQTDTNPLLVNPEPRAGGGGSADVVSNLTQFQRDTALLI